MPERRIGQLDFRDARMSGRSRRGRSALAELSKLVDWTGFEKVLQAVPIARKGEARYPALAMFKVLLLQRWHALSDPEMEAALADRLSFLAFAGFAERDETPDHSTIWRFREKLIALGVLDELLAETNRQLEKAGMVVKQGTLIDATLVRSAARRPRMDEPKTSAVDTDARFGTTNERGRYEFGYKMHVALDAGSHLVRGMRVTSANEQEVAAAPALLGRAAGVVYADRAYDSDALRRQLAERGLGDGLMRRRRGRELSPEDVERNHDLSLVRRAVESLFGTMKRSYRLSRMRAFSKARNVADLTLFCIAFNLRRWRVLAAG